MCFLVIALPKPDSNAFSDHYVITGVSLLELRSLHSTHLLIQNKKNAMVGFYNNILNIQTNSAWQEGVGSCWNIYWNEYIIKLLLKLCLRFMNIYRENFLWFLPYRTFTLHFLNVLFTNLRYNIPSYFTTLRDFHLFLKVIYAAYCYQA
jgi:hypothetical protein